MKKSENESREEYDFGTGTRGRHLRKASAEGTLVRLDPDVAKRFPTSEAVNEALRSLANSRPRN